MIHRFPVSRTAFVLALLATSAAAVAQERPAPAREPGRLEQFGRDVSGAFGSIFAQDNPQANQAATSGQSPASPQMAQMAPTDMVMRIDQLERQIRSLTGAIEQLQYRNQQLEQQVRRLEDEASRTQSAPRGAVPRSPPAAAVIPSQPQQSPAPLPSPTGRRNDAFDPTQNPSAPGAPRPLGSPGSRSEAEDPTRPSMPGVIASAEPRGDAIGNVIAPEDNPVGVPGGREPGEPLDLTRSSTPRASDSPQSNPLPGQQTASLPPAQTPRDEFDLAYGYVMRKDYALAEDGLRGFLKKYPSDRLAGDAQFWLGESMFQRQKFRDAADAFVAMAKKYDGHAKAPDALLRLAQSLAALNEKELACATFGEVSRKYPRASTGIKQTVEREQKRVRC